MAKVLTLAESGNVAVRHVWAIMGKRLGRGESDEKEIHAVRK